jgi:hypothetical protein
MTCRVAAGLQDQVSRGTLVGFWETHDSVAPDQVEILVELAREGEEATFKELATCLNPVLSDEDLNQIWCGTVARLKRLRSTDGA